VLVVLEMLFYTVDFFANVSGVLQINGKISKGAKNSHHTVLFLPKIEAHIVKHTVYQQPVIHNLLHHQETPHGLNWYADLFRQTEFMQGWERWQLPTCTNPLIPREELEEARSEMGSLAFAQEYEAQFVSASAGIFQRDWFQIIDNADPAGRSVRYWDLAASVEGDWTVGVRMSRDSDGHFVIEDVTRGRWTPFERDKIIRRTAESDGGSVEIGLEQEPGSAGVSVVDSLIRMLAGYCVRAYRPTGSKAVRAQPFAAQCEARNVKLARAHWNREYLAELQRFPEGRFDDQVDSSSGCFSCLTAGNGRYIEGELLCSGEDPVEERRPFSDEELAELPDYLHELVAEARASALEKAGWDEDWREFG
jgi:predicted phage terminase large subunit-like protein